MAYVKSSESQLTTDLDLLNKKLDDLGEQKEKFEQEGHEKGE